MFTIIRGMPGSGKSTLAKEIEITGNAIRIEPDDFITKNGKYHYSPENWNHACKACQEFLKILCSLDPVPDIVYADVLPTKKEVDELLNIFRIAKPGEPYKVIDMPLLTVEEARKKNIHNVRMEDLERMYRTFECWTP